MTDLELKKLKKDLWHAADVLRSSAHIAANKYGQPILGLIFLRYADILYKQHKAEIDAEYEKDKGTFLERKPWEIAVEKCGFYLPECAYYDYINDSPDTAEKATVVKKAMEEIEKYNIAMDGVLPKEVYGQLVPEEEPELLSRIVRIFKDIPENISIDLFGEIYEYFLGNFALSEGKDGGTFYTPASVVRYMVEVIQPEAGSEKKILDPACGSGGMFVQAARYMHRHNATNDIDMKFRCYGVEKEPDTVKLAKMNLFLNNVRGEIKEANSFYSDPYNAVGSFDYVMANPPFNVDEVVYDKVKDDLRFNQYGIPKNKTSSSKKNSDKKETVPNANYLWINYFATALNENGKAALVMANSASDAGKSELEIRKQLIEAGIIKQMVTLPSNMFTSVTLPATLWFFDKAKSNSDKKDEILFIDARNVFTQVDRAHRKFSDEQVKNLGIISRLYEGKTDEFYALIAEYETAKVNAPENSDDEDIKTKAYYQEQIDWLNERFPNGTYNDVIGLCKVAKLDGEDGIIDQDYSLNAGRYVGVVIEDDGMTEEEFKQTMLNLNAELSALNAQAQELEQQIAENIKGLFGEKTEVNTFEKMLEDYEREINDFYFPQFNNLSETKKFVDTVYSYDWNNRIPRRMLYQVQRFVSLADEIDKIRPARDGLRILFYRTCLESLSYLSGFKGEEKIRFFTSFSKCFSQNGEKYILNNFKHFHFKDEIKNIGMVSHSFELNIEDFLMIIRAIRNNVVHDGNYWENQVFALDNDGNWISTLTTNEKIISKYNYPNGKKQIEYIFTTTLQYEKFRFYFIEACVNYINQYCEKLNGEDIKC